MKTLIASRIAPAALPEHPAPRNTRSASLLPVPAAIASICRPKYRRSHGEQALNEVRAIPFIDDFQSDNFHGIAQQVEVARAISARAHATARACRASRAVRRTVRIALLRQ